MENQDKLFKEKLWQLQNNREEVENNAKTEVDPHYLKTSHKLLYYNALLERDASGKLVNKSLLTKDVIEDIIKTLNELVRLKEKNGNLANEQQEAYDKFQLFLNELLNENGPLDKESSKIIKSALHLERQRFTSKKQMALFKQEIEKGGEELQSLVKANKIEGYGIYHTEAQSKALDAIQKLFTESDYKGNISKEVALSNLKDIKEIPILRISPANFLESYGVGKTTNKRGYDEYLPRQRNEALDALQSLATSQYFFYYERLAYDEKGKPLMDKNGNYKKQAVTTIDTLIKVKNVYHEDLTDEQKEAVQKGTSKQKIKYYEIEPSPIFIDQINTHFLLKPAGWREEIKLLSGGKSSKYTFSFANWLMIQFEDKRRSNSEFIIRMNWQNIATAIKIPPTTIKRNKKSAKGILSKAYKMAYDLGYLKEYEVSDDVDILVLNENKFVKPKEG